MTILGIDAFHGDSSAAFFSDDQLLAAVEEERFNRIKHWAGLPLLAARNCLNGSSPDHVAISRDPRAHLLDKILRVAVRPTHWTKTASSAQNSLRVARVGDALRHAGICSARSNPAQMQRDVLMLLRRFGRSRPKAEAAAPPSRHDSRGRGSRPTCGRSTSGAWAGGRSPTAS